MLRCYWHKYVTENKYDCRLLSNTAILRVDEATLFIYYCLPYQTVILNHRKNILLRWRWYDFIIENGGFYIPDCTILS